MLKLGQYLMVENGKYFILGLVDRIDTLRVVAANAAATVGQHPVCLGASAVGYEFHCRKSKQINLKNGILL